MTRKRPRSTTSSDSATTYKRGASEDAIASAASTPSAMVTSPADVDAYMQEQESGDIALHDGTSIPSLDSIGSSSEPMPSPSGQLTLIETFSRKRPQPREIWYIVARDWYQKWHDACSGRISKTTVAPTGPIGPIRNDNITSPDGSLRLEPLLIEGEDIEYLPEEAWNLLVEWYDLKLLWLPYLSTYL